MHERAQSWLWRYGMFLFSPKKVFTYDEPCRWILPTLLWMSLINAFTTARSERSLISIHMGHQIAASPPPHHHHHDVIRSISARSLKHAIFVLTIYPKKGGNIQVATTVSELLVGKTPVKMHLLSLARALSAMEDDKETCFIWDKKRYITQINRHTFFVSATLYDRSTSPPLCIRKLCEEDIMQTELRAIYNRLELTILTLYTKWTFLPLLSIQ